MIHKKLMREFFQGVLLQEHPGEGAEVGILNRRRSKGGFCHWEVEVYFRAHSLRIDPLIWLKIRGTIFGESFGEAIEKTSSVEAEALHCPDRHIHPEIVRVSGRIHFEESELYDRWPGLLEGKNPYG